MSASTVLHLHTGFAVGPVDPRMFGGFLEHMGRAVYEGVYQPGSAHADADGCRRDVLEALAGLDMTAMRYPGGNFASGYHWQDGVGPREQRPTVRELAWNTIETNEFGPNEFLRLAQRMDWTPMLTVNLGTGTPEEARNWVEYTNGALGTKYADLRAAHGHPEPWGVGLWCLGNEMDGPWQLGHVPADHYGLRAQQAAKLMKSLDPKLELVVSGSSHPAMRSYLEWDRVALECVGSLADYVSTHLYVGNREDDSDDYLAIGASIDRQIEEIDAVCRYVAGKRRRSGRAFIAFDEWNVWYRTQNPEGLDPKGQHPPHLIEEVYNLEDALVVAAFLHSFVRHADCVKIANIAQIANVIAPILTRGDDLLIQSIYHPFRMFSQRRHGHALRVHTEGPRYRSATRGDVSNVDASAILDGRELKVFATNRTAAPAPLEISVADADITSVTDADLLTAADIKTTNTYDKPDLVQSRPFDAFKLTNGRADTELPPHSLLAATLRLA